MSDKIHILRSAIEESFSNVTMPTKEELVHFDGYDQLDKEHAVETFLNKSREDILKVFTEENTIKSFGTFSDIEDLIVLTPKGVHYYIEPYFTHLLNSFEESKIDYEYLNSLLFAIIQILERDNPDIFTQEQYVVLSELSIFLSEEIKNVNDENMDWIEETKEKISKLKEEIQKKT